MSRADPPFDRSTATGRYSTAPKAEPAARQASHFERRCSTSSSFPACRRADLQGQFLLAADRPQTPADIDLVLALRAIVFGYFLKSVVADNLQDITAQVAYPQFLRLCFDRPCLFDRCLFGPDFRGLRRLLAACHRLCRAVWLPAARQFQHALHRRDFLGVLDALAHFAVLLPAGVPLLPVGGNRRGPLRTYVNLMIVMALGGLWHGAALSYLAWGIFHGLALVIERLFRPPRLLHKSPAAMAALRIVLVFTVVSFGWLLFKLPNFDEVLAYLSAIWTNGAKPSYVSYVAVWLYAAPVVAMHLWYLARRLGSETARACRGGVALRRKDRAAGGTWTRARVHRLEQWQAQCLHLFPILGARPDWPVRRCSPA